MCRRNKLTFNHGCDSNTFCFFFCFDFSMGFPGVALVKCLPANAGNVRDLGFIPGLGRSPGGGNGNPLQYSCLENAIDRGPWWAVVHRVTKSRLHTHIILICFFLCFGFYIFDHTMYFIPFGFFSTYPKHLFMSLTWNHFSGHTVLSNDCPGLFHDGCCWTHCSVMEC